MKDIKHIKVSNRKATFKLELRRNITIICGDSGTGKTTLFNMIADYARLGDASGVNLSSDNPCVALVDSPYWQKQLADTKDSIIFVDEGMKAIFSSDFAKAIRGSNNYYVIITREALHELPYSVDEIYEIKTSGKIHTLRQRYNAVDNKHTYIVGENKEEVILTEDAKAGYEFFLNYANDKHLQCISAQANSNIYKWLRDNPHVPTLVIADGAAFGAEIDRVLKECKKSKGLHQLCLPESFEWLILKSGLVKVAGIEAVLDNPADYIESSNYFSWEQFFTAYLIECTNGTPFQYQKDKLNLVYVIPNNSEKILKEIK